MKYQVKVTAIGSMVAELSADGDLLILFNDSVQDPDLRDIAVAHTGSKVTEDIVPGDVLTIGDKKFNVKAVGDIAVKTLNDLGHCTIKFDRDSKTNLPGEIHVDGLVPEVKVGDIISFE